MSDPDPLAGLTATADAADTAPMPLLTTLRARAGSFFCRMGRHERSRGRAKRTTAGWVSRCRRCDVPMQRSPKGRWSVTPPEVEPELPDFDAAELAEIDGLSPASPPPSAEPDATPDLPGSRRTGLFRRKARG
jgi:hypothetical protein